MDYGKNYILVTPVKNEAPRLRQLMNCVTGQNVKPVCWIIVDDGSTDGSYDHIRSCMANNSWIRCIQLNTCRKRREIGFNYSRVTAEGFIRIIEHCRMNNINYDYIALLDADMTVDASYFKNLMLKFEEFPTLGIASGIVMSKNGTKVIYEKEPPEWPCGAARMWSRACFDETGWSISRAPDSASSAKAMLRGYLTRNFPDLIAWQSRLTYSGSNFWSGYMELGKTRYYLGYTPIFAFFAGFKYLFTFPFFGIAPFLIGYFGEIFSYQQRSADGEIRNFFKQRLSFRLKRLAVGMWAKLKNVGS